MHTVQPVTEQQSVFGQVSLGEPNRTGGLYRSLEPSDWTAVQAHYLRLSAGDRVIRFGGWVPDAFVQTYCERAAGSGQTGFGYMDNGQVHGVAEFVLADVPHTPEAEIAISVEAHSARDLIRERLLGLALEAARDRLIRVVVIQVHSDEFWPRSLLTSLGARFDPARECMRIPVGLAFARLQARSRGNSPSDRPTPEEDMIAAL